MVDRIAARTLDPYTAAHTLLRRALQLPDSPITQLPNSPITQLPD
jgi:hypothetical protein